jgi:hypothetical protein
MNGPSVFQVSSSEPQSRHLAFQPRIANPEKLLSNVADVYEF